jgi:hypothetical protein
MPRGSRSGKTSSKKSYSSHSNSSYGNKQNEYAAVAHSRHSTRNENKSEDIKSGSYNSNVFSSAIGGALIGAGIGGIINEKSHINNNNDVSERTFMYKCDEFKFNYDQCMSNNNNNNNNTHCKDLLNAYNECIIKHTN